LGLLLVVVSLGACSSGPGQTTANGPTTPATSTAPGTPVPTTAASPASGSRALLIDTDVAGDDLVALAFALASPNVDVVGITVSGTGEAHCAGGVDVVLRLLERLQAPEIPVACGRETPLAGNHAFPDAWRERVDAGSGLDLPQTTRTPSTMSAIDLLGSLAADHPKMTVLTLGPLTNLADALNADSSLASRLGRVFVMGGALTVPGNLVCCGAPEGNSVAEWNIYVDPHAAQVVVASGLDVAFVSLDGTNQVPVTTGFAERAMTGATSPGRRVLADIFAANPFMTEGGYYLWDPLAAEFAAGYEIGTFTPVGLVVEEAEGPESGYTRLTYGPANASYLSTVDAAAAESTLLRVLDGG